MIVGIFIKIGNILFTIMTQTKLCISYCRANGLEFFPNTEYKIEFNPIDKQLRIYNCWGGTIIPKWFVNENFI